MSIGSTTNRNDYIGNGAVDTYPYSFRILDDDHLRVIVRLISTGVETTLTKTTHYTVTGVGDASGGNVALVNGAFAWLDGDGDLLATYALTIRRVVPITQETDIRNQGSFFPETHEDVFDYLTMIEQQQQDEVDRSMKLPETIAASEFNMEWPADAVGKVNGVPMFNDDGDGFAPASEWPTAATIATAEANAVAAAASAAAALVSENNADASEAAAAAAAVAAQAAVDSVAFRDTVFKTVADSPITIVDADKGKLFAIDASGGAVTVNLPEISGLTLSNPWVIAIKKTDSSGNIITVNRGGTDTIDGNTSKGFNTANAGSIFLPDVDPSPDRWTSAEFGATAGNFTVNNFNGDASTTGFTLTVDPGSENNTQVYVDGVYQQKDTYSVSGTTLTFTEAPPTGTSNIEVIIGTALAIGTPSDSTVTRAKMVAGAVAAEVVRSVTTTDSPTDADDLLVLSGASFTVTLPTAAGRSGKRFELIHNGTSATQVYTLATTGGQTIGGVASGSYKLVTNGEMLRIVSDGSNWFILDHKTTTAWTAFTPTGSWSSNSTYTGWWRRDGDEAEFIMRVSTSGAPTAATLTFNIPTAVGAVDSSKLPGTAGVRGPTVGVCVTYDDDSTDYLDSMDGIVRLDSSTTLRPMSGPIPDSAQNHYVKLVNATNPFTFANNDFVDISVKLPMTDWQP
jgi:hypothetical protein